MIAGVAFIDHDHVGMFQVGVAGGMKGAIDHGAMLRQNLAPVGQKLRIVVLADAMGLETAPDIDMHPIGVLPLHPGNALRSRSASPLGPGLRLHRRPQKEQE